MYNIGDDVYNTAINKMGVCMGVHGDKVCVRTTNGLEHWYVNDCENRTECDE